MKVYFCHCKNTVFVCFTAVLWKPCGLDRLDSLMSGFWVTLLVHRWKRPFKPREMSFSRSLRALAVSASSCLLFLAPGSYKRHFLRLHWLSYRSSCVRLEAGKPETATVTFCSCRLSCAPVCNSEPRICRYWILRVLLGSLSCNCSEVIEIFDRRIWRIISGEVSVSLQPWATLTLR